MGASTDRLEPLFPPEPPSEKVRVADASDLVHPDVVEEHEEGQFPLGPYLSSQHGGLAHELVQQGTSGTVGSACSYSSRWGNKQTKCNCFVFRCLYHTYHEAKNADRLSPIQHLLFNKMLRESRVTRTSWWKASGIAIGLTCTVNPPKRYYIHTQQSKTTALARNR